MNEYHPDRVSAPGEILQETLAERGLAYDAFAAQMGITTEQLIGLFDGLTELTPAIAESLEKLLGTPARFWLSWEKNCREHLAQKHIA